MSAVCTLEGFGECLMRVCEKHVQEQKMVGRNVVQRAARTSARTLRNGAATPRGKGKTGGTYAKGFRSKKTADADDVVEYEVGNAGDEKTLVHLLEKGHELIFFGNPTGTRTRAFPHMEPAFQEGAEIIRRASVS